MEIADDGGVSWSQLARGPRRTAVQRPDGQHVLVEAPEDVIAQQSELGLQAGAYAWDRTARS